MDAQPPHTPAGHPPRLTRLRRPAARLGLGALIGALSAGVALAVGEVIAIFTGPSSAPVYAVGEAAVNLTPAPLKEWAIAHFGENDKPMLILGILVLLTAIALLAGILALRHYAFGAALIALFGAIGVAAAVDQPDAVWTWALPSVIGALAAIAVLRLLSRSARHARPPAPPVPSRRSFLITAGSVAAGSAAVGFGADLISSRRYDVSAARAAVRIPKPAYPAPPVPRGAHPGIAGLSPFFTDNDAFYRVDTDLVLPQVRPESWTLRIHGMVDRPVELSFGDLLKQPLHEHDLTLSCVSDPVGGPYVGNARWIGASVPALLRAAGVRSGADQLLARSTEGMTIGTPLESVLDGRNALLAVAMNGQPLPIAHGFPARMLVPGFYGYASACKWVTDLEVTTFAAEQAYWVRRGYARVGTMKTQSRIDVPKPFAHLNTGTVTVAGIAWATDRGIAAVQVRVDDGPWQQARLAPADSPDTWRQWTYDWPAAAGTHSLQVRAADDSGAYQPAAEQGPYPSGASGYESLVVVVS